MIEIAFKRETERRRRRRTRRRGGGGVVWKKGRVMSQGAVISYLLKKFANEAGLLTKVGKEVEGLRSELEFINAFLNEADKRGETDEVIKTWVKQVWDVSYDIEDVLDEFVLRIKRFHGRGFIHSLQKTVQRAKEIKRRHQIGTQLKELNKRVREIRERCDRYSFNTPRGGENSNDAGFSRRMSSRFNEETQLVSIDRPSEQLIGWLEKGESKLTVISVVGMGGIGKTTLVEMVFNKVEEHFDCHAWITVSKSLVLRRS
ncbi:PREDICTED: putative disease resistance protein At1g50180 [Nelumbo nucifera]|uniref:Disease resistance protein At1g50180 n=1 Tax=Nelumbo nucifera TaxID=4432 RepID=A0A1U8AX90_NELNU|nr:PREDICTED: putative disease resistance protein At1g50180 [Nelumbo nucifera]XP_010272843.1 PREDICTED: putative disease resistance protein At1g50180 [Nelumbo nucifera]